MLSKGHKKYLRNPTLGLIPFAVYLLCFYFTLEVRWSLILGLLFAVICQLFFKYYGKSKVATLSFGFSSLALFLTLITNFFLRNIVLSRDIYLIICEIYMVCIIMIIRIFEDKIKRYYFKNRQFAQKPFFDDFFKTMRFIQYSFSIYLFAVLIYVFLYGDAIKLPITESILYILIPLLLMLITVLSEAVKIRDISKKLHREEWLPIINEKGEVSGKIARSESEKIGNRFMHPVIRIALIMDDKIFLLPRDNNDILDAGALDHPFEMYLPFDRDINITARDSIANVIEVEESENTSFRFLLKYTFSNENTNRLIFLYALKIKNESQIRNLNLLKGKFWTNKQIEENRSLLSECLQKEYEYLKNTILMADKIKNAQKPSA